MFYSTVEAAVQVVRQHKIPQDHNYINKWMF